MKTMRYSLLAGTLALVLMGAGCSSTTTNTNTANTNVDPAGGTFPANSNTSNQNDTPDADTGDAAVDPAGGTFLANSNTSNLNDTPDTDTGTEDDTEADMVETKTFDVVSSKYAFSPSTITVNEGDTVVLNLTTSDVPHGFAISEFDVNATITPGKTKTVEFVADQAGSYTFTCSVACGAGHNSMRGTLVVN